MTEAKCCALTAANLPGRLFAVPNTIVMKILVLLCAFLVTFSSQAANIYFVSFHGSDLPSANAAGAGLTNAPDKGYTDLLTANGHTVTRVVSIDDLNTNVFAPADLVIISRSVASGHYQQDNETAAWNGLAKPVMILGGYVLRGSRLGFTSGETIPDTTNSTVKLKALAPGHPIFNGIALDSNGLMANGYANRVMYTNLQQGISVNTSAITNGGVVLGVIGNPLNDPAVGGTVIAEWLPGAIMANPGPGTPPARDVLGGRRLVFLTGSREQSITSEAAGMYDLTADGAQMFLNAVDYMTTGTSSIRTVTTTNNETPGAETSLLQVLGSLNDGDYVRFNIPGAGPHTIVTPIGGYPLITNNGVIIDGYTQPGSVRNSNPILGGNNAQLKIVLDSTGTESAPNPDPTLPDRLLRRSTRLDFPGIEGNTGYGDSENCIIGFYEADNCAVRGLSFIARTTSSDESDPAIYCIALVRQATNAHVSGCLFGMAPGGTTTAALRPPASAVAAFRWRVGGDVFSDGLTFGTDGDGIDDRAEFNVTLGARIALALELNGPKISGNYGNVFPSGTNFVDIDAVYAQQLVLLPDDASLEFLENGRVANNSVVGTDGDGISDSDERNVIGHTVYDVHIEFYSSPATNNVIAGNYVGVGIDGVTQAPRSTNQVQDFVALPSPGSARIGSNGDGVSDDLEGNLIVNGSGDFFTTGSAVPVVYRRNRLVNCNYIQLNNDTSLLPPTLNAITNNIISGTMTPLFGEYITAFIDVYVADPAALANTNDWPNVMTHPSRWLASFTDNGPGDLDIAPDAFAFNISSFGVADSNYVTVTVTYSKETTASNAGLAVTTEPAAPVSRRPSLTISVTDTEAIVSWIAPDDSFVLQQNNSFNPNTWLELFVHEHTGGRNVVTAAKDTFPGPTFFRLISQ